MDKSKQNKFRTWIFMLMGSAGIMSASFPLDLVRTRLQTSPELLKRGDISTQYKGFFDCFKEVYQKQKWAAFWKGNGPNLIRFFISQSFNFAWKQTIQTTIRRKNPVQTQSIFYSFGINFISGTFGSLMTVAFIYPFEFCRQRLSNDITGKKSIISILREVKREQGIRGIYKGCANFFITASTFRSFYFGIFDTIKRLDPQNMRLKVFAAYIASIISIYIVYPLDTLRKRMIMAAGKNYGYKNIYDAFMKIYRNQGLKAIYRGGSLVMIQAWTSTIILCFYDKLGQDIRQMTAQDQLYQTF